MIRIEGIARTPGIAIAVTAVVDVIRGINSVDPDILQKGMDSLKRQLVPSEYPEVVIACDSLAVGLSTQLPGLTTIGVAAESDTDISSLNTSLPCVIGLQDLIGSIQKGDLIVLDGNEGVVYIDPDPDILVRYQQEMGVFIPKHRIDMGNITGPVTTMSGETVLVYTIIRTPEDLNVLDEEMSDGILLLGHPADGINYASVLRKFAGKPTWILLDKVTPDFLQSVGDYAAPGQVNVIFEPGNFDKGLIDITLATAAGPRLQSGDFDVPWVSTGISTAGPDLLDNFEVSHVLLMGGLWEDPMPDIERAGKVLHDKSSDRVLVYVGENLDFIKQTVEYGFRSIAVNPGLTTSAKEYIRNL